MDFDGYPLPDDLAIMIPDGVRIPQASNRFCGHPKLIHHCQEKGWLYRVRLKRKLALSHRSEELAVGDLPRLGLRGLEDADLYGRDFTTSIGSLL